MTFAWKPNAEDEGTGVIFHVVEMPQLQLHTFHVEPSTFGLQMNLPEGTPMSRLRAHQIANQAQQDLRSDGFRTATVDYDLVPFIGNKVDLHLNIDAGERIRVKAGGIHRRHRVRFERSSPATLRSLKIRRVTPPIPGIWNGWRLYPGYSPEGVQGDLALLRSYYISKGYFDATVKLDDVQVAQKAAHVNIQVQAGQLYHVRTWQVSGNGVMPKVVHPLNGLMRSQNFCSTLFVARREAEHDGILDFTVNLQVQPTEASTPEAPEADLNASIDRGNPFHVGRIEFTGNRHFTEAAVRSNFLLDEGDLAGRAPAAQEHGAFERSQFFRTRQRTHHHDSYGSENWHRRYRYSSDGAQARLLESIRTRWAGQRCGAARSLHPYASAGVGIGSAGGIHLHASRSACSLSSIRFFRPLGVPKIPLIPIAALNRPYTPEPRLEIGIHDHSATGLAIHGAGLRSVAAGASLASAIARRSRPGAGAACHRGHSQQPNHDVLRTAGAALCTGADRPCDGPAFRRVGGGPLESLWPLAVSPRRLASAG